ncbi:MAG: DUF305 domain-containing protein [Candidatus Pacebacteria bacterium]|jgi:uncharacterized protein (DUF305 family)|nr:DUF305 domain-containing protein [Candidatus Paceibacterota bacterium]
MDQKTLVVGGGALLLGVAIGILILPWVHHGGAHDKHGDRHDRYEKSATKDRAMDTMVHDSHNMDTMMADMMRALDGKTGAEFDEVFLREMIVHHEGAVMMAQAALERASDQRIKDLATAIIAAQEKEIADMESWQNAGE